MNRHTDGFMDSRGTVLVASDSSTFINIVGDMLVDGGFTVAYPAESEAAWLSVTRTQPALVICDSGVAETSIKRLIAEVTERRLPLLMAWSQEEHDEYAPGAVLPDRVAWLTFPIEHDAFLSTIDGLMPQVLGAAQRLRLTANGVSVQPANGGRPLVGPAATEGRNGEIPDRTVRRSIRLLP